MFRKKPVKLCNILCIILLACLLLCQFLPFWHVNDTAVPEIFRGGTSFAG